MFGDGHDYDWALAEDEEAAYEVEQKSEMKYQDVRILTVYVARVLIISIGVRAVRDSCSYVDGG